MGYRQFELSKERFDLFYKYIPKIQKFIKILICLITS